MLRINDSINQYTISISGQLVLINSFEEAFLTPDEINLLENEFEVLNTIVTNFDILRFSKSIISNGEPELVDGRNDEDIFDDEGEIIGTTLLPNHQKYQEALAFASGVDERVQLLDSIHVGSDENTRVLDDNYSLFITLLPNVVINRTLVETRIAETKRTLAIATVAQATNSLTDNLYSFVPNMEYDSFSNRVREARAMFNNGITGVTTEELSTTYPILFHEHLITQQPLLEIAEFVAAEGFKLEQFSGLVAGEVRKIAQEIRALPITDDFQAYADSKIPAMQARLLAVLSQ